MAAGAEHHLLRRVVQVGFAVVVRAGQGVEIDEVGRLGRCSGARVHVAILPQRPGCRDPLSGWSARARTGSLSGMAKNSSDFVLRPFEGLPGEPDWVALKELVPAATATARTTKKYGARDVLVTTVLPTSWPALHRADGLVLLALQTTSSSNDVSRDLAHALLEAIEVEAGTAVETIGLPEPGPRLQDVLDLSVPFEVTVQDSFAYWLAPDTERTPDLQARDRGGRRRHHRHRQARVRRRRVLVPDGRPRVPALGAAARGAGGARRARPPARQARVRVRGRQVRRLLPLRPAWSSRCGSWPKGSEAEDIEKPVADFLPRFEAALADTTPLDANERRARAGLVARQVTLR